MRYDSRRALDLLKRGTGRQNARFREGQHEAIRHLAEGRGRQLLVQKTGWGKSFVYFITTRLLREAGLGPTLLVSPLLALMRNQIAAAERMGVRAETINSDNQGEWDRVEQAARADAVDILLVAPERLANERFRDQVLVEIAGRIALLVIDEAHCISDWGHDFRPHYRLIERTVRDLPPNVRLLATPATANARVMADLEAILGPNLQVLRGDLNRPSLALQTVRMPGQAERLAWLAETLPSLPGNGIVYTLTVRDAELVAAWLKFRGIEVAAYTGETGPNRQALEQALLDNRVKALVATTALGMGFDKPDLAFVIHYQTPGSVVAYYQQVGRAGRALAAARGVLLGGGEDTEITNYFIRSAFPTRRCSVSGVRTRRPPGWPPFRRCGTRVSCPTSRAVSPPRWTCRSGTCCRRRVPDRNRRQWRTATVRPATSSARSPSPKALSGPAPCCWSTTSWTPDGPSLSPRGSCAGGGAARFGR